MTKKMANLEKGMILIFLLLLLIYWVVDIKMADEEQMQYDHG